MGADFYEKLKQEDRREWVFQAYNRDLPARITDRLRTLKRLYFSRTMMSSRTVME